jgi:tRNA nucleotidyltransferase (CCA-adding enzyme)
VNYINKKVKSSKILNEIKIAKAFCYANHCYGAESYINGFSGYSLELLVYYYKGFMNFIRAMAKIEKGEKCIIDIEKKFKNKKDVLIDLNSSKLNSPIILIDPTYKQRNALAALSQEVFEKFKKVCKEFIKNPSIKLFEIKKVDVEKIKKDSLKKGKEFALIEAKTNKQEGDIAGSKLLKFYNYLEKEINRLFIVKNKGFNYNNKQSARYFFVAEKKKEILCSGPFAKDEKNVQNFKKEHKNIFKKGDRLYAKEKVNLSLKEFLNKWKVKNAHIINEMYMESLNLHK